MSEDYALSPEQVDALNRENRELLERSLLDAVLREHDTNHCPVSLDAFVETEWSDGEKVIDYAGSLMWRRDIGLPYINRYREIEESREPGTRPEKPVGVIHGHPHKQRHLNTSEVNWEIETFSRDGQLNARIVENDDVIICEIVGSPEACGNSEAARLIAAAPKLHRALKAILSNPGGRCTADQWRAGLDALSSVEPIQ